MIKKFDVEYKDGLFIDFHLPESSEFDVFVYFHGGGLTAGTRKGFEVFTKTLAKHNVATASVEYRLYPEAKFPDFITDCALAVGWIKDNINAYGKCKRIFVGGSSAGGYISMMLCFDDRYLGAVKMSPTDIAGYIHDAGQPTSHFSVLKEFNEDSRKVIVDKTAPLYFVGNAQKYAPMLFIVSDNDMFGRYEQTMLMVKTLEHFGHKDKVFLQVMHGEHCEYVRKKDNSNEGVFAKLILKYIDKMVGKEANEGD